MNSDDEKVRAAIAEQAGEWFVANDEAPLDARDAAALAAWLKTSPVHIEEFLGVSAVARDLKSAGNHEEYSLEAILARARLEDDTAVQALGFSATARTGARAGAGQPSQPPRRRRNAIVGVAACAVLSLGLAVIWNVSRFLQPSDAVATELHFETRHGEQLTRRLADDSVLHLDTDSAVTIRYSDTERFVALTAGQADFEVVHDGNRAFRVLAGPAEILDVGTQFDVRLERGSTVVTVVDGRVAVALSPVQDKHVNSQSPPPPNPNSPLQLGPDQQLRVTRGDWPTTPIAVDAQRTTSWLRREIVFDHEPLEQVAAEYNRYAPKPIEITTPALKNLEITGAFATDDPDAFVAFLRSLKGVKVQVTPTQIRVSGD